MKTRRSLALVSIFCIGAGALTIVGSGCSGSRVQVGIGRPIDPPKDGEEAHGGGLTVQGSHNTGARSGSGSATNRQSSGSRQPTIRSGRGGAGRPR